jgi:hypothetical protein
MPMAAAVTMKLPSTGRSRSRRARTIKRAASPVRPNQTAVSAIATFMSSEMRAPVTQTPSATTAMTTGTAAIFTPAGVERRTPWCTVRSVRLSTGAFNGGCGMFRLL